jgi:glucokinase
MSALPHAEDATTATPAIAVGLEIADSGTRLAAYVAGEPEGRRWHRRLAAPPSPAEAVAALQTLVADVVRDAGVMRASGIGVAVWGRVKAWRGVVAHYGHSAAWDGYPLAATLSAGLGAPVAVASAMATGALAEAAEWDPAGRERILYVHNGRSITSALVAGGTVQASEGGADGQFGHLRVRADGPRCSCGLQGHLEPLASAQAIVRRMIGRAADSDASTAAMHRITGGRAETMTAAQVVALAAEGDPVAAAVVAEAEDALAVALASAVALLAPELIIIGGPLAQAGDAFLGRLWDRLDSLTAPFAPVPSLQWSALEPFAALRGAALLAVHAPSPPLSPQGEGQGVTTR